MGYGLGCSPFCLCTRHVLNCGKRISTLSLHISRVIPLLTIGGRISKGFDFLGYSFEPKGLSIAPKTLANFLERITQLYKQGTDCRRIGQYVRNYCPAGGIPLGSPIGGPPGAGAKPIFVPTSPSLCGSPPSGG